MIFDNLFFKTATHKVYSAHDINDVFNKDRHLPNIPVNAEWYESNMFITAVCFLFLIKNLVNGTGRSPQGYMQVRDSHTMPAYII